MLAYGGGSVKKNGVYDEIRSLLQEAEKEIVEFSGIMPNPTYQKLQEGAELAQKNNVDFIQKKKLQRCTVDYRLMMKRKTPSQIP